MPCGALQLCGLQRSAESWRRKGSLLLAGVPIGIVMVIRATRVIRKRLIGRTRSKKGRLKRTCIAYHQSSTRRTLPPAAHRRGPRSRRRDRQRGRHAAPDYESASRASANHGAHAGRDPAAHRPAVVVGVPDGVRVGVRCSSAKRAVRSWPAAGASARYLPRLPLHAAIRRVRAGDRLSAGPIDHWQQIAFLVDPRRRGIRRGRRLRQRAERLLRGAPDSGTLPHRTSCVRQAAVCKTSRNWPRPWT